MVALHRSDVEEAATTEPVDNPSADLGINATRRTLAARSTVEDENRSWCLAQITPRKIRCVRFSSAREKDEPAATTYAPLSGVQIESASFALSFDVEPSSSSLIFLSCSDHALQRVRLSLCDDRPSLSLTLVLQIVSSVAVLAATAHDLSPESDRPYKCLLAVAYHYPRNETQTSWMDVASTAHNNQQPNTRRQTYHLKQYI